MARPMNLGQLRSEVYARLGETSGFFTDAQINQWLVDGVDDIALHVEPLVVNATLDVTASQGEYLLPDSLISIKKAFYKDTTPTTAEWYELRETTYEDLFEDTPAWENDTTRLPDQWYWRQDVIGVYPKPDTTESAVLRILYTCRPAEMSGDTSTTGLPSFLDRAAVLYAVARCFLKDRDELRANVSRQEYNGQINEAVRKLNKHRKDHAPRLEVMQRAYRNYYQRVGQRPLIRITT